VFFVRWEGLRLDRRGERMDFYRRTPRAVRARSGRRAGA
jgi:hypothetical protein